MILKSLFTHLVFSSILLSGEDHFRCALAKQKSFHLSEIGAITLLSEVSHNTQFPKGPNQFKIDDWNHNIAGRFLDEMLIFLPFEAFDAHKYLLDIYFGFVDLPSQKSLLSLIENSGQDRISENVFFKNAVKPYWDDESIKNWIPGAVNAYKDGSMHHIYDPTKTYMENHVMYVQEWCKQILEDASLLNYWMEEEVQYIRKFIDQPNRLNALTLWVIIVHVRSRLMVTNIKRVLKKVSKKRPVFIEVGAGHVPYVAKRLKKYFTMKVITDHGEERCETYEGEIKKLEASLTIKNEL